MMHGFCSTRELQRLLSSVVAVALLFFGTIGAFGHTDGACSTQQSRSAQFINSIATDESAPCATHCAVCDVLAQLVSSAFVVDLPILTEITVSLEYTSTIDSHSESLLNLHSSRAPPSA